MGWTGASERTLLLKGVRFLGTDVEAADHIWFNETKGFQALGTLEQGEIVEFDARVKEYRKGYWGNDWERQIEHPPGFDYKLSHPTKIQRRQGETVHTS
jgi:hypothetical protein